MLKTENYYEKSFTDLAKLYYDKFQIPFPISLLKVVENKEIKTKIINCLISGESYNYYDDRKFCINQINNKIDYVELINLIKQSMDEIGYDYQKMINDINSVVNLRLNGKTFSFEEHLEALVLAQLSNHRWGDETINRNRENLRHIFKFYNREYLKKIDPEVLTKEVININCGNASIYRQMKALSYNITILEKIEKDYEHLDCFVASAEPNTIANILYDGKYKLNQVGKAFALDYLKKVGINTCKSDSQITRLFGSNRLSLVNNHIATALETMSIIKKISKDTLISEIEVNSLLWQFCLPRGANICTKNPNCYLCKLNHLCNYNN